MYTSLLIQTPPPFHSDAQYYGPYLIAKANWMQSTALDTSKNSKSMQHVTRMMDCICTVQSFHSVLHFAAQGKGWVGVEGKGGGKLARLPTCFLTASNAISKLLSHLYAHTQL